MRFQYHYTTVPKTKTILLNNFFFLTTKWSSFLVYFYFELVVGLLRDGGRGDAVREAGSKNRTRVPGSDRNRTPETDQFNFMVNQVVIVYRCICQNDDVIYG